MDTLTESKVKSLKVTELKSELTSRSLSSDGGKAVLVKRLLDAIGAESAPSVDAGPVGDEAVTPSADDAPGSLLCAVPVIGNTPTPTPVDECGLENKDNSGKVINTGSVIGSSAAEPEKSIAPSPVTMVKEEEVPPCDEIRPPTGDSGESAGSGKEDCTDAVVYSEQLKSSGSAEVHGDTVTATDVQDSTTDVQDSTADAVVKTESDKCLAGDNKAALNVKGRSTAALQTKIVLDAYNSDLHFVLAGAGLEGSTVCSAPGFGHMWAGARATHGVDGGRVCFEVRIIDHVTVAIMDDNPPELQYLARFGWSASQLDYSLGESQESYGYGGTGKISVGNTFKTYGEPFARGDTVTCYLDMESSPRTVSYSKNGQHLGTAFSISESSDSVLFPHVYLKNVRVSVNFGASSPAFPLEDGYVMIEHAHAAFLKQGPAAPASFSQCKVLMMVGLPASGKTTWCKKYQKDHPEERFSILGTNSIMEQMRVFNLQRKRNYHGRFDKLMDAASKVHNKLFDIVKQKKRNLILDQTNVYVNARRRKISNFRHFGEKQGVVVVVSQAELDRRTAAREKIEGKLVPDHAVLEMKRNFVLPEITDGFSSIVFVEEGEGSSRSIVARYKEEARAAQPDPDCNPPAKRPFPKCDDSGRPPSLLGEYRQHRPDLAARGGHQHHSPAGDPGTQRRPLMDTPPLLDTHSHPPLLGRGGRSRGHSGYSSRTGYGHTPRPSGHHFQDDGSYRRHRPGARDHQRGSGHRRSQEGWDVGGHRPWPRTDPPNAQQHTSPGGGRGDVQPGGGQNRNYHSTDYGVDASQPSSTYPYRDGVSQGQPERLQQYSQQRPHGSGGEYQTTSYTQPASQLKPLIQQTPQHQQQQQSASVGQYSQYSQPAVQPQAGSSQYGGGTTVAGGVGGQQSTVATGYQYNAGTNQPCGQQYQATSSYNTSQASYGQQSTTYAAGQHNTAVAGSQYANSAAVAGGQYANSAAFTGGQYANTAAVAGSQYGTQAPQYPSGTTSYTPQPYTPYVASQGQYTQPQTQQAPAAYSVPSSYGYGSHPSAGQGASTSLSNNVSSPYQAQYGAQQQQPTYQYGSQ